MLTDKIPNLPTTCSAIGSLCATLSTPPMTFMTLQTYSPWWSYVTLAIRRRASRPRSKTVSDDGVASLCSHWYVGAGLPSATHSKVAEVNRGAVVSLSGPMDRIFGGSEKKSKFRTHFKMSKHVLDKSATTSEVGVDPSTLDWVKILLHIWGLWTLSLGLDHKNSMKYTGDVSQVK